jgi:hypothetical protein
VATLKKMDLQKAFAEHWKHFDVRSETILKPDVNSALAAVRDLSNDGKLVHAFVTGCAHLVGAALSILQ